MPRSAYRLLLPALFLVLPALTIRLLAQAPAPSTTLDGAAADAASHAKPGLKPPASPRLPTVFLVGDSTVRNGNADGVSGQWGWGEPLADLFDATKINVDNRALGGRSSRTYITEGHWDETLAVVRPGDVVLLQFGYDEASPLDDPARARGTLPGVGDETREIENPILKIHEWVHSYGWYIRKYAVDAIGAGATPVVCSPVPRKTWSGGKIVRLDDTYGGWARVIAVQQHVAFVDLNEMIARKYEALGQPAVESLFADPNTHTARAGAELNAEAVVSGLKSLPKDPLAGFYSAKGTGIPAFRP